MAETKRKLSRRDFLKVTGAATAAVTVGGNTRVLKSLVRDAHAAEIPAPEWESKFSVCDMCFNKCGLIARVDKGKVVKLDPNPKFLKSRGMLCARGNAGIGQLYDPDRLKYPLLRKGARGEGKWQRIP